MPIKYAQGHTTSSAKLKVGLSGAAGVVVFLLVGSLTDWRIGPLLGWDTAALTFAIWTWAAIWPMSGRITADHALREDPSRAVTDILVLASSLASLVAVGVVLEAASDSQGTTKLLLVALGVLSVVVSWLIVHTVFALHYAELYYRGIPGGVDFQGAPEPSYKDFAYLAFTVGMTFQVSDTSFESTDFRRAALRHSLLSYLFGTIIVASTINLIAGLTK